MADATCEYGSQRYKALLRLEQVQAPVSRRFERQTKVISGVALTRGHALRIANDA